MSRCRPVHRARVIDSQIRAAEPRAGDRGKSGAGRVVAGMAGTTFGLFQARQALAAEAQQYAIAEQRERAATAAEQLARKREQDEKEGAEQAEEVSDFVGRQALTQGSARGQSSKTRAWSTGL